MIEAIAQIVGWTLIHSLWQGAVVAAVTGLVLAVVPRASARTRYAVLCAALLTHLAAPFVTAAVLAPDLLDNARSSTLTSATNGTLIPPSTGVRNPAPQVLPDDAGPATSSEGLLARLTSAASNLRLERFLPLAVAVWALGVLLTAVRRIGGWMLLRRIVSRAEPLTGPVAARVKNLAHAMGVWRSITVLVSREISGPFTIGWLRPVIVMPMAMLSGLDPVHMDAIVAHELAHVRRWDYLVAIIQSIATTVLFHHPATWWLDRRLRVEREYCCDDLAVAVSRDRVGYVRALAELESIRLGLPSLALAATDGSLESRAVRLLSGRASATPGGWVPAAALMAILGAATVLNAASAPSIPPLPPPSTAAVPNDSATISSAREVVQQADVIKHPDPSAPFETRWTWAMDQVRRRGSNDDVVIGWMVRSAINDGSMIISSTNGTSWSRGRSVAETLGLPRTVARGVGIFVSVSGGSDGQLQAVLLRDINASLALGDRPLLWLHSANDAASIARLEQLLTLRNGSSIRSELAAALTLHDDRAGVLRAVTRVFDTESDQQVRGEAISWLGNRSNDSAVVALLRRAVDDPAPEVRDEALTSLGGARGGRGQSVLLELLGSSKYADVRSEVVQKLAGGGDDVVAVLLRIAFDDPEEDVRSEAVDAIKETRGNAATQALRDIAQRHPERQLRSEARDALDERGFR